MPDEFSEKKSRLERMYIADALCDGGDSRELEGKEVDRKKDTTSTVMNRAKGVGI